MTIQDLKDKNLIIYQVITGSQAYGTAEETSDTDRKGIFMIPIDMLLSGNYIEQVSDETNDNTYYELGKFMFLLGKGDPTAIEMISAYDGVIEIEHSIMSYIKDNTNIFITKKLKSTFGEYAKRQIIKAKGLNKKINKPIGKTKKTPLDFCMVVDGYKTYPLKQYLKTNNLVQNFCGVVKLPNAEGLFALFYDEYSHCCFYDQIPIEERKTNQAKYQNLLKGYKGIIKESENGELVSNDIRYSSIPKSENPLILFSYNMNGYVKFCKDYSEYWSWVNKRNPIRYNTNMKHGKGYDGKNMAHCHRLLDICLEIGQGLGVNILRPNREQLLLIKHGEYDLDTLIAEAESKIEQIDVAYESANLPNSVNDEVVKQYLLQMRKDFYKI